MHEDNHNEPVLASHMHMESSHPLLLLGMLLPSMVSRKGREPRGATVPRSPAVRTETPPYGPAEKEA